MTESFTPAGWFPDPLGRHEHRYFNGTSWTADVADGGQRFVDPLGASPGPSPGGTGKNGLATAALVCGIIGVVLAWIPFIGFAGLVLAVLALVFGIRGLRRSQTAHAGRGASITGIVTGLIGLALGVVGIVLSVVFFRAIDEFASPGPVVTNVTGCTIAGGTTVVTGELTNVSDERRDYTVFVTVDRNTEIFELESVAPDETVPWSTTTTAPRSGRGCDPDVVVQGPFPFGIELDPIDP